MNEPRAKTKEEVREELLAHIRQLAGYWATIPGKTERERCDGLAFSILVIFDGQTMALPAMNLSLSPHPDNKEFNRSEGEDWYEPGMVINDDCHLHDLYYPRKD